MGQGALAFQDATLKVKVLDYSKRNELNDLPAEFRGNPRDHHGCEWMLVSPVPHVHVTIFPFGDHVYPLMTDTLLKPSSLVGRSYVFAMLTNMCDAIVLPVSAARFTRRRSSSAGGISNAIASTS